MHRKKVLFIRDGMTAPQALVAAVSAIDADFATCSSSEMASQVDSVDLVVASIDAARINYVFDVEKALAAANNLPALLLVEPDALKALRLPTRVPCDFALPVAGPEELMVRLRHLLWPGEEASSADFLAIDSMTINFATYQVAVEGTPVDFTYLEYALLAFLVTHPGHAYSRDALLRRVWGFDYYGGSRTVDVHVRRVRAKLGSELSTRLVTVRGVGYMWDM